MFFFLLHWLYCFCCCSFFSPKYVTQRKLGGTLKIYGESLCRDVPYKTLLLSIRDCAQAVVREMLSKYGLDKADPLHYCLVQVNSDGTEYILDDDECPLSILMNHPTSRGLYHISSPIKHNFVVWMNIWCMCVRCIAFINTQHNYQLFGNAN